MATPFSQVKPSSIKLKVQVRYPGSFVGEDSIVATTANSVVTVKSDYERLTPSGIVPSPAGAYFKGWDSVNGGFFRVSYNELTSGSVDSAAAAAAAQAAAETAEAGAEAALAAAEAIASTGVLDVTSGPGVSIAGTTRHPVVNVTQPVRGDNLLPNTDWLLSSKIIGAVSSVSKTRVNGDALTAQINVTSFTTSSGAPTFLTSNTGDLVNGSIVVFGAGLAGLSGWGLRVFNVVANTSFQVAIPFNKATPSTSSAITAFPCGITNSGANTYAPDHWVKTSSLTIFVDDYVANSCPGALRVLGMRKTTTGAEYVYSDTRGNYANQGNIDIRKLRGKTVTFGAYVRVKSGGVGSKLIVNEIFSGSNNAHYSSAVTGSAYVNAATNNYEFLSVTTTVSLSALALNIGIETNGAIGSILYLASPTLKLGNYMVAEDLGAPAHEIILAETHWNPPCTVPLGSDNVLGVASSTPSTELVSGSGLYGWQSIDVEAIGYGQCHGSVQKVNCKIELKTPTVGCIIFVAALDVDNVQLTFGPQTQTNVANIVSSTSMGWLALKKGAASIGSPPGCFAIFSNLATQGITNITFDFDDVMAS